MTNKKDCRMAKLIVSDVQKPKSHCLISMVTTGQVGTVHHVRCMNFSCPRLRSGRVIPISNWRVMRNFLPRCEFMHKRTFQWMKLNIIHFSNHGVWTRKPTRVTVLPFTGWYALLDTGTVSPNWNTPFPVINCSETNDFTGSFGF